MKLKTLKELFALTAFSFAFANMSIVANAEELSEENKADSDQEDSVETDADSQSGPIDFEKAEENLENAKREEEQAKAELDNAQTEVDSAQSDLDNAKQDSVDADDELEQAQTKKEEAEATKESADIKVSETEQTVKDAEESLNQILEDSDISEEDYNSACEELEKKEAEIEEAKQTVTEAEAENIDKKKEVDETAAEVDTAKEVLKNTEQEKEAADQAVSDAQTEVDAAQKEYDEALNPSDTDNDVEAAQKTMNEAQAALEEAEEKVASGSLGFFQSVAQEGDESAQAAVAILTSEDGADVSGMRGEESWAADDWEDFISYTHIGNEDDATSLNNMKAVFDYIEECNSLRTDDDNFTDLVDLQVNDALMAIAQLNANWAVYNDGNFNTHSKVFNTGENLAWYPKGWDPFRGWYDKEKEYYDAGNTTWDSENGHYLNITNGNYYATGYGINSDSNRNDAHAQEFNGQSNISWYGYGESYSLEEYKDRFMTYYNNVMTELDNAKSAYDAAKAAYDQAVAGGSTSSGNQADIENKKAALDQAETVLKAAEVEAETKLEALNTAQAVYDAALQKQEIVQAEYVQSEETLTNLKDNLQQKQNEYEALLDDLQENFTPETVDAIHNLKEAQTAYKDALNGQIEADKAFEEAKTVLASAIGTKAAADQNVLEKSGILSEKQQILKTAQNAYYLALANLTIAQDDYDRLKPKENTSHSSGSQGDHVVTAAENEYKEETVQNEYDTGVKIIVDDISKGDSRRVFINKRCSFTSYLNMLTSFVAKCPYQNITIDCSNQPWFSLNRQTLESLRNRSDMSITVLYNYMGKKYSFTIPAGYDFSVLKDSSEWYGFMYLKAVFGGYEVA